MHLGCQTPGGRNPIQQARGLLDELERLGILTLPARQGRGRGLQKPVETGARSDPRPVIAGPLAELTPPELAVASGGQEAVEWNEWVQCYHPLGYRQPIGNPPSFIGLTSSGSPWLPLPSP